MNFTQAISTVFRENYANFKGRASRAEFWWFFLFVIIIDMIFYAVFLMAGGLEWLTAIYTAMMNGDPQIPAASGFIKFLAFLYIAWRLVVLLPTLAVTTRRFHDRNLSGWILFALIVATIIPYLGFLAWIAILVICALAGDTGDNKYGVKPIA